MGHNYLDLKKNSLAFGLGGAVMPGEEGDECPHLSPNLLQLCLKNSSWLRAGYDNRGSNRQTGRQTKLQKKCDI